MTTSNAFHKDIQVRTNLLATNYDKHLQAAYRAIEESDGTQDLQDLHDRLIAGANRLQQAREAMRPYREYVFTSNIQGRYNLAQNDPALHSDLDERLFSALRDEDKAELGNLLQAASEIADEWHAASKDLDAMLAEWAKYFGEDQDKALVDEDADEDESLF